MLKFVIVTLIKFYKHLKMAKSSVKFICQECGTWHSKWAGKCEGCGTWNTLVEEVVQTKKTTPVSTTQAQFVSINSATEELPRLLTGVNEFDRVCGGGLVPGSVLLVGGDPGIGKSTLLLQVVASFSHKSPCVYISGEEAVSQVRMRAKRLNVNHNQSLQLAATTNVQEIIQAIESHPQKLEVAIIDSIQTLTSEGVDSSPGTVSQVRACTHELITLAKKKNITVILVGHVTKEGIIAGPRVLEHMVDTVLYFEGDRNYHYRILRSVKNRFGPTDEIGVFEMTGTGLKEVLNPSALFLGNHEYPVSGSAIFGGMEGTRPILIEVQALVAPSYIATPRRTSVGWDASRLSMIIAVLETRCGLSFANKDVYLNIAGGLKINEPAADLAVAAALISSLTNVPSPKGSIFFGEIGLSGEVRAVHQADLRLKESQKLGFESAFFAQKTKTSNLKSSLKQQNLQFTVELLDIYRNQSHIIPNTIKTSF